MKKINQEGYILVLTLLVISVITILVTQVFYQSSANLSLMDTLVKKEKAKVLAISGIQLAIDKLSVQVKKEEEKKDQIAVNNKEQKAPAQSGDDKLTKELLKSILPVINKWQIIEFKEDSEGISGKLNICICCENGKFNINKIYDFQKHQFLNQGQMKNDYLKVMQDLFKKMESYLDKKDAMQAFTKYLSERKFPLNETTELLNIGSFNYFKDNVFLSNVENEKNKKIYLTDIFTIWTDSNKLEPWLLSDSVQSLLALNGNKDDIAKREQVAPNWISKFKKNNDWSKDWNEILKLVYNKDFASLSKTIVDIFNTTFTAKVFSVISYGTVSGVTQKVFAILHLTTKENGTQVSLKKLYWI